MIWIIGVVVLGLVVVLAELLLSFQKRVHELRQHQDPLRRRIRQHNQAMQEAVTKIQGSGEAQVVELEEQLVGHTQQLSAFSDTLSGLESELFGADYDPRAPALPKEEDEEEDTRDDGLGALSKKAREKEESPEELVHQARDEYEEVQGHRTSLMRDLEVIKRTLGMLEGKLRTSPAAGGNKKK